MACPPPPTRHSAPTGAAPHRRCAAPSSRLPFSSLHGLVCRGAATQDIRRELKIKALVVLESAPNMDIVVQRSLSEPVQNATIMNSNITRSSFGRRMRGRLSSTSARSAATRSMRTAKKKVSYYQGMDMGGRNCSCHWLTIDVQQNFSCHALTIDRFPAAAKSWCRS
ncbi:uncharacterized protein LOC119307579 [Triticum dicoccoides]|uniref:uncharacterized protein LOC119307579 n=1 Tax=Triticum dicoccoides TaxID=85692 RepID=UPI00188E2138|nr:uncharacterized protein LOC119307579 [Triticum dicoccoides]